MRERFYRYNSKTCKFEASGRGWPWLVLNLFLILGFSAGVFYLLFLLHSNFFETPYESKLRKENHEMRTLQASLFQSLESLDGVVSELKKQEEEIHFELLHEPLKGQPETNESISWTSADEFMILADQQLAKVKHQLAKTRSTQALKKLPDSEALNHLPKHFPLAETEVILEVSGFGSRIHPFHKGKYIHEGIDLAIPKETPVLAAGDGIVTRTHYGDIDAGYGNYVEITHGDGYVTRYAHLGSVKTKKGSKIKAGDVIAYSGNSGGSASPHLHFEVIKDGKHVNPVPYFLTGISTQKLSRIYKLSLHTNQAFD